MRIALAFAMLVSLAPAALAESIEADATGTDSSFATNFWGVDYISGGSHLQSVTFDLTADSDAYFDFDGSSFSGATAPVLGSLSGLTANDITVTTSGNVGGYASHPSVLTFSFASKSFAPGDSFRFSADTDALGIGVPDPGSVIADSGVVFSLVYEDGTSRTVAFESVSDNVAVAAIHSPEPGTWTLLLLAFGIFAWRTRRRRAA